MKCNEIKMGILILFAGILMSACKAEPAPEDPNSVNGMILRASMPDGVTKTTLSADYQVLWQTGDQVSVNGTLSNAVASEDNGKKAVEFTIDGTLKAPYTVLYPGTTSSNVISLPATQNYVAGSFDPAAAASFGNARKSGDSYSASLTHFCGILRFALKGSATLSKIELNALGGEKLYGNFTLATNSDGFTGSWTGGTAGKLTYDFGSGLTLSGTDTPIYVAIPAQAYASGIEALVYQQDGAFMRLKFWGSGNSLDANDLIVFEPKTFAAGRTENLLEIGSLEAENGGVPTTSRPAVTVAVYNLKQQANRLDGAYSEYISMDRSDVKTCMGATIAALGADVIGFNEFNSAYLSGGTYDIKALAEANGMPSNYEWHMNYPNDTERDGIWPLYTYSAELDYANGFAFNPSTLNLEDSGYVWISQTENDYWSTAKNAYENSAGRHTVVWALFTHKASGKQFYFFVTHFATYIDKTAEEQLKNTYNTQSLQTFAQAKVNGTKPIIVVGDLNYGSVEKDSPHANVPNYGTLTSYWTDSWAKLNSEGNLPSFYQSYDATLNGSSHKYYYPWTTFIKGKPWHRIDYVLTKNGSSQSITPISYKTIRLTYTAEDENPRCPSDHLPVIVKLEFD